VARYVTASIAALGGLATLVPVTLAQTPGNGLGPVTRAFFESTLDASDNYNLSTDPVGNSLIWTNTLGVGLVQETDTDLFTIDAQGSYRASSLPSTDDVNGFDDPRLALLFNREIGEDFLTFSAAFRRVDLDFFDPLRNISPDGTFDNSTDGTRESANIALGARFNDDGPIVFAVDGLYNNVRFTDTDDPDNNDRVIAEIGAEVGFRLSPMLTATLGADYGQRVYEKDTLNDRYRTTVDVGFDALVNQRMTAFARIGYSEVDVEGDGTSSQENGIVGALGFSAEMQDGEVRGEASSELNEFGTRNRITVGRLLLLRTGSFDVNIGATNSDVTDVRPIGDLRYVRNLPRSQIVANFRQNATINDQSENALVSYLDLGFRRELTRLSSFNVGVEAGLTRYEDSDRVDSRRGGATASYGHALTRDWGLDVGYRYQWREDENEQDAQSNSVFLTLRRDWQALR
jgi:hypothetical protein